MSKSRHSEAQIIGVLKQVEAGRSVEDVARDQGVSKHTIYAWKSKYGGMEVSEAQEVKQLREENSRLKKLVADLSLVGSALNIQYGCTATQNNGKITSQSDVMSDTSPGTVIGVSSGSGTASSSVRPGMASCWASNRAKSSSSKPVTLTLKFSSPSAASSSRNSSSSHPAFSASRLSAIT